MAFTADDQGFSFASGHDLDPVRSFATALDHKIREFPYVMNFDVLPRSTEFAFVRSESGFQFRAGNHAIFVN